METAANHVIDALGGTSAVSRLLVVPTSTIHSWRKNGIPPSRFAHLKLAAANAGFEVDLDGIVAAHNATGTVSQITATTGNDGAISAQTAEQVA